MSKVDDIRARSKLNRIQRFKMLEIDARKEIKAEFKKLDIVLGKKIAKGANTSLYLPEKLNSLYGRKNLCLKVFDHSTVMWGAVSPEGCSSIVESTIVQNLMAIRGLAPRVYDLVSVRGKTAQVTDYLQGGKKVVPISDPRFTFNRKEIKKDYNFLDGKLIDFQAACFQNMKEYKQQLVKSSISVTQFPQYQDGLYQSLDYYPGKRETKARIKLYNFKNFTNKKVFDVGCNLGMFCRHSFDSGAKIVVGMDKPEIIEKARELAIMDCYFNIDFYGIDLETATIDDIVKLTGIKKFDIILFLAMEMWIGRPEYLKLCKTLYFEGHGVKREVRIEHN